MSDITIKEIPYNKGKYYLTSSKFFNDFLYFPYKLYKNDKMWVPPLLIDERNTFNKKINPALEWCEYRIFLAYKDGELSGRIVGIINNEANRIWKRKYLRFGWLDCIEDVEVFKALFNQLNSWAKERGLTKIVGPMGFTDMDKEGMIVEGFETLCPMAALYNPAYYPKMMEQIGFQKEVDWIQYEIPASQQVPEKISRINNLIAQKYNLRIVEGISKKKLLNVMGKNF